MNAIPRELESVAVLGLEQNGMMMTPEEYDAIEDYDDIYRYELINGVLVVSPFAIEAERDPNEEFGFLLRLYKEQHPKGYSLDKTLFEHTLRIVGGNRRRADRVIWTGLGRTPRPKKDSPSIIAEFVSEGRRSWLRDYITKGDEYMKSGAKEYLVIDRFRRLMTVYAKKLKKIRDRVIAENETYETPLLPGFQLPLARLLTLADKWAQVDDE